MRTVYVIALDQGLWNVGDTIAEAVINGLFPADGYNGDVPVENMRGRLYAVTVANDREACLVRIAVNGALEAPKQSTVRCLDNVHIGNVLAMHSDFLDKCDEMQERAIIETVLPPKDKSK